MGDITKEIRHQRIICISGASGFLGNAAIHKFARSGYKVVALSRPTSKFIPWDHDDAVVQINGTVDDWISVIKEEKPAHVISFDWSGVSRESRDDSLQQESNVDRVSRLAEVSKSVGAKSFMALGSQAEIKPSIHTISESEADEPQSLYGVAKITTRQQIQSILAESETRFIWGRVFTVYGPGDIRDSLITQLIKKLRSNENFDISNPNGLWSFLYIDDFTEAIYALHKDIRISGIVNIGNPKSSKIGEVVDHIAASLGKSRNVTKSVSTDPKAMDLTWIPDTSTLTGLDWSPKISLNTGLENTIRWWEQNSK